MMNPVSSRCGRRVIFSAVHLMSATGKGDILLGTGEILFKFRRDRNAATVIPSDPIMLFTKDLAVFGKQGFITKSGPYRDTNVINLKWPEVCRKGPCSPHSSF